MDVGDLGPRMTWEALEHVVTHGAGSWHATYAEHLDATRYTFRFRWPPATTALALASVTSHGMQVLTWTVLVTSHEQRMDEERQLVMARLNAAVFQTHGGWSNEIRLLIREQTVAARYKGLAVMMDKHQALYGMSAALDLVHKEMEQLKLELEHIKATLKVEYQSLENTPPADEVDGHRVVSDLEKLLPGLREVQECPDPDCTEEKEPLRAIIIHLNDVHRWTREEVADWLDTLDVDLQFPPGGLPRLPEFDPEIGDLLVIAPNLRVAQDAMLAAGVPRHHWLYVNGVADLRGWLKPQMVVIDPPGISQRSWPSRRKVLLTQARRVQAVEVALPVRSPG